MQFDIEWHDTPAEGDPLECKTWARLIWRVGSCVATQAYDRRARGEREGIYVPLYPLARWIVDNWWSLLYETWPSEEIPTPGTSSSPDVRSWLHAHCARTALSGYAFPFICIFSRGQDVAVISRPDPRGRYTSTPIEFTESVESYVNRDEVSRVLTGLITDVLDHLEQHDFADERTEALQSDWAGIRAQTAIESEFCRAAGRLGLDPHQVDTWPTHVLSWFERSRPGELDRAFTSDILDAPDPLTSKPDRYEAFRRLAEQHSLTAANHVYGPPPRNSAAHEDGYDVARWIRNQLGLSKTDGLKDLRDAARAACSHELLVTESQRIPSGRVLAAVGWRENPGPIVLARPSPRESARFVWGRGLYLALRGAKDGPRLVTDAKTWDQRASRAFSAEILAPREGVVEMYKDDAADSGDDAAMLKVATHYNVSTMVIKHQLDNA